jgi:hypothetical protein
MVSWQVGYAPGVALLLPVLHNSADAVRLVHLWWVLDVAMTWQAGSTHPGTHSSSLRLDHRATPLRRSRGFRGSRSCLVTVILLGFLWWVVSEPLKWERQGPHLEYP